jgi:hypothetical protein
MQTKIQVEPMNASAVEPRRKLEGRWVLDCPDCHKDFTYTELRPDDESRGVASTSRQDRSGVKSYGHPRNCA